MLDLPPDGGRPKLSRIYPFQPMQGGPKKGDSDIDSRSLFVRGEFPPDKGKCPNVLTIIWEGLCKQGRAAAEVHMQRCTSKRHFAKQAIRETNIVSECCTRMEVADTMCTSAAHRQTPVKTRG